MQYDYVIVGAGSAGSVLAGRLTEDPSKSVLLLEAGLDYPDPETMPNRAKYIHGISLMNEGDRKDPKNNVSWDFWGKMTEQNAKTIVARGKIVGGSGAINSQAFMRGEPEDYDAWAATGLPEWSYQKCLPYWRKVETDIDYPGGDFHGSDGPIPVRRYKRDEWMPSAVAFYDACRKLGFPDNSDFNYPGNTGVGAMMQNRVDNRRWGPGIAFLNPARHRLNLTIRSNVLAHKVIFDGKRATGVLVESEGEKYVVEGKEIILSSGAIGSPHLLMLSGVGPSEELKAVGIPVLHDLPGVGKSLMDDTGVRLTFKTKPEHKPDPMSPSLQLYLRYADPVLKDQRNSIMIGFIGIATKSRRDPEPIGVSMGCMMYLRKGRGQVNIQSPDVTVQPLLDYKHMEFPIDRERMRSAIRLAVSIAEESPLKEFIEERIVPTDEDLASDEALDNYIMKDANSVAHISCTCKMGPASNPMAVVDQHGHVHGLDGIRVIDASIFPSQPRCATNGPTCMTAEHMADFIKQGL